MKRRPFWQRLRSLRVQLFLWAILPLSLALIAVAFTGVYGHERGMYRMVEERDRLIAQSYADRVADILSHYGAEDVPAAVWEDLFGQARVDRRGVIYLLDPMGQVVYHPDKALCGADYSGHSAIPELLVEPMGSTPCRSPDGEHMLISYATAGETGWRVVVEEPWEDLIDPILRLPGLVPFVAGVAGVVAVLALAFGARTIVVPLRRLAWAAGRVSWGNFAAIEEPVTGVEEIEELQAALQDMAARIQGYQAGMRDYLGAITEAQEAERTRLARELHDETVQSLIALGQRLEMAHRALERGQVEPARAQIADLRRLCKETMEEVRRFSRALRPLYLEDLGLVPALEMLAREAASQGGIQVQVRSEGPERRLSPERELALYRIAQEALNNAVQHAQAGHIWLTLRFDDEAVTLTVSDDGSGFALPDRPDRLTHEGHFGLLGMRERALLAGGELQITSEAERGTTITTRFPFQCPPLQGRRPDQDGSAAG